MAVTIDSIIAFLLNTNFDTLEWDGVEITLYSNGEPWGIQEFVDGHTRILWEKLQDDLEYTYLPNKYLKVTI